MKHLSWKLLTVMLDANRAQVYNIFAESTTFMLQILMLNGNESFWQICADEMLETRTDGTFVWFGVASTASSLKNMDCTLILTCVSLRRVFLPHWLMVRFHISLYLGINNNLSSASWNIYESCLFCQPWVNRRSINVMRSFLAIDPLPGNILILRQNGNKKNQFVCVSPSLRVSVSLLPSRLLLLLSYRVFICFCFVRKAHQKPTWIWNMCRGVPRGPRSAAAATAAAAAAAAAARRVSATWKFICHTDDDNLDGKWNMKLLCARQSFPGSCRRPLMVLNTSGKLRRTRANDL